MYPCVRTWEHKKEEYVSVEEAEEEELVLELIAG
jgi:hypothetical protein